MPDNSQKEIAELKRQVAILMKWKDEKEKQQLKYPLDKVSMSALDNAFRNHIFTEVRVKDIMFAPQLIYPAKAGQMRFCNNLVIQNMRVNLGTYEGRFVLANP